MQTPAFPSGAWPPIMLSMAGLILAVFGDVHGNLPGLYELCERWEREQAERIDLVLQTGDMGLWRSAEEMDRATQKHFADDRSELAGADYLSGKREAPLATWFVHGNHEDFRLLSQAESRALDPAGRIVFLGPGSVRAYAARGAELHVAALGGMEYRFGKHPIPSEERVQKYLHPPSLDALLRERPPVEVLLLHDAPFNKGLRARFPTGSQRITALIRALSPRFAFYGHYDDPPEPFRIGDTFCACLNYPGARRIPGRDGAMGILRSSPWAFDYVAP
jgi:hypothetical protein